MSASRRTFLQQVSTAAALGLLSQVPARRLWAAAPGDFLPDTDEALLRELALKALEAARTAGAAFADVRVAAGRRLALQCAFDRRRGPSPRMEPPGMVLTVGYGIRAVVDGAWGVAAGSELTPDGVARVAQAAVARARSNRPRRPRTLELAPTPRMNSGKWATPIEQDPFAMPVGAQADLQLAALAEVARTTGVRAASVGFTWQRADRVFASSEGAVQVQRVDLAFPGAEVTGQAGEEYDPVAERVPALLRGGYGYEAVARVSLTDELRQAAERAIAGSKTLPPLTATEVGRYDLVCTAGTVAKLLTETVAEAVNAERVLGYRANHEGTSFAAPPGEVLGKLRVGSPLLTVRADRSQPHGAATVGWDDEGVKPDDFTFIQDGVLVDYHTTRETAAELAGWYRSRNEPVRSHGCASGAGQRRPTVQLPNLTLEPGKREASVEDLIADTKRGFYIEGIWGQSDQQVLNGQFGTTWRVRQIRNGKLTGRSRDLAFQFITPAFWKSLDALGGPGSAELGPQGTDYQYTGDGIQLPYAGVRTVPARFRDVNILNTGRTA